MRKDTTDMAKRAGRSLTRVTVILTAAGILAASISGCGRSTGDGSEETVSTSGYTEEPVKLRDITTYHSFTGTIAPVTERNVLPDITGVKVTEVKVEKGDEVKEGDVLMVLDADSLNEQIAELKATIDAAKASSDASIRSAQSSYYQAAQNINDGLDQSIQTAKSQMDSAESSLVTAQQAYNNEVSLNNQQMSSTVMSAKQQVDSAYGQLQSAQENVKTAELTLQQAQQDRDIAINQGVSGDALVPYDQKVDSANAQVESSQVSADSAQTSYDNAVQSYEAAKQGEEDTLTNLYDQLITAQTTYVNAVDAYNAAVRSSQNQLQTYANQIASAQAGSDQTSNELKLADLEDQLGDCEVKAPIDGVVTALNVTEGDVAASAQPAAVITSFDKMKIDIKINEYDILGVEEGNPVTINIDALDKDYSGTIRTISRVATVDNGVSYFESEVDFDGDEDARSGMSAEVRMVVDQALNAASVRSDAIQTADDGSTYVYVYADDRQKTMKRQAVTIGVSDGTYTEIKDGVYPGDRVLYQPSTSSLSDLQQEMEGGSGGGPGADGGAE